MDMINVIGALFLLVAAGIVILIVLVAGIVAVIGWLYNKLVDGED